VRTLSGGNQQRLVIARALAAHPQVLLAENPARGLDVRAAGAVWRRLREAAALGATVIVAIGDLDEALAETDRLLVMAAGEVHAVAPGASRAEIGALMLRGNRTA
jgi:simple sugar transport system ATP-binding protein